ncbi:dynamin family protein [Ruegeria sp. YS9]|uniref:dynamin family protein n=1 Tax=Ruegeria sp. YS9 TaxID=2966453 RepID=UPI00214A9C62|nr:dynamin family protein [Ruegeria sp. YS9]UUV07904.1 dynamin family protein [Ruegeria sp. YS9]
MAKDTQTRFVSPKAWERIEQWSRRKPVFALMGEFSAGKSTLMNFLLRTQTLPTQVTATQLPPVWFSWGNQAPYIKRHDGSIELIELDQLETVGVNDAQFIRIYLEADILEAVDLIDTPGISDPKISTDVWQRAVGQANGVLWCTHATQAWRETERATWVSLPERLQHNSLLLVTRADALSLKDRQKVLRRVNREAGHLFNRSILFSARDAITARDKTGDAEMWSRSGGGKMIDSFLEITEQIMDNRADQLARYQIDKSQADAPKVKPLRPARSSNEPTAKDEATPLRLVNPLEAAGQSNAEGETVVTSFPVRPARVERRSDEAERVRIDAEEAERLRAEMTSEPVPLPVEPDTSDDLRSLFKDTSNDPLELTNVAGLEDDEDEFELSVDADLEDSLDDAPSALEDAEISPAPLAAVDESDDVLASLNTSMQETSIVPDGEDEESKQADLAEDRGIEVSVSSITALMAAQTGNNADDYEPEPETSGLIEAATTEQVDAVERSVASLGGLPEVAVGSPLSASDMWQEVSRNEDLPQDAEGLKNVFKAFLAEFDQIAIEHNEKQTKEALRAIPKAKENSGAEWHVL